MEDSQLQAPPLQQREQQGGGGEYPKQLEFFQAQAVQPQHKDKYLRRGKLRVEQRPPLPMPGQCRDREFIFSILHNTALYMNMPLYCYSIETIPEHKSHYFGSHIFSGIHDIETAENYFLHIKVATEDPKQRLVSRVNDYFHNEAYFYHCIDYRLKMFLREELDRPFVDTENDRAFFMIALTGFYIDRGYGDMYHYEAMGTMRYARVDSEPEIIVMSNLYKEGFKPALYNFFTQDQMFTALRELAKFHALSMAFKVARPKEFQKFLDERSPTLLYPEFSPVIFREVIDSLKEMYNILRVWGIDDVTKLKVFVDHAEGYFHNVIGYNGHFTCLVHMDCALNKFLFNATDDRMKFTDFYHWCPGTAIYDISYLLFTRGHYRQFSNVIKTILETYYEMFIVFCAGFGWNAHTMYPYREMTREFNLYHRFGLFMAIHYFVKKIPNTKRGMAQERTNYMAKMRLRNIYRWLCDIDYFVSNPVYV